MNDLAPGLNENDLALGLSLSLVDVAFLSSFFSSFFSAVSFLSEVVALVSLLASLLSGSTFFSSNETLTFDTSGDDALASEGANLTSFVTPAAGAAEAAPAAPPSRLV